MQNIDKNIFKVIITKSIQIIIIAFLILSANILFNGGSSMEIKGTVLGQEKVQLLEQIPYIGKVIIEQCTINLLVGYILFIAWVIYILIRSEYKFGFLEVLTATLCGIGYYVNVQILNNIKKTQDIIYENDWFFIQKIYTLGEKVQYYKTLLKQKCDEGEIPYTKSLDNEKNISLNALNLSEIKELVEKKYILMEKQFLAAQYAKDAFYITDYLPSVKTALTITGIVLCIGVCIVGFNVMKDYFDINLDTTKNATAKYAKSLTEKFTEQSDSIITLTKNTANLAELINKESQVNKEALLDMANNIKAFQYQIFKLIEPLLKNKENMTKLLEPSAVPVPKQEWVKLMEDQIVELYTFMEKITEVVTELAEKIGV